MVATLPVIGCLPIHIIPPNSYQNCDEEYNKNARIHNKLLLKAVTKLNTDDGKKSTFVVLDLYNAMVSAIDQFRKGAGNFSVHVFSTTICFYMYLKLKAWSTFILSICHSKCRVQEPVAAMLLKNCWSYMLSGRSVPESQVIFLFWSDTPFRQWLECYFFVFAMFSQQRSKSLRMLPSIFRSTKSQTLYVVHLQFHPWWLYSILKKWASL